MRVRLVDGAGMFDILKIVIYYVDMSRKLNRRYHREAVPRTLMLGVPDAKFSQQNQRPGYYLSILN